MMKSKPPHSIHRLKTQEKAEWRRVSGKRTADERPVLGTELRKKRLEMELSL